jgi:uncharacterized phage-associated protein
MQVIAKEKILSCLDIANYFLVLVDREAGDSITQLKLQKLVYFAQGISLALLDKSLFPEHVEAWTHGTVVPALYRQFRTFGYNAIPAPGEIDFDLYSRQQKELIYKVYAVYGEHTASYLRNLTHEHQIWSDAMLSKDKILAQDKMQKFFKALIKPAFLSITKEDSAAIVRAEDEWWMSYDDGEPVEDVTDEVNSRIENFMHNKGKYSADNLV